MKILNYGSMNIDNVYSVEHMARPGETILATGRGVFCGGKGLNQSIAIAKAGGQVCHAGIVGEDGGMLLDALHAAKVDTACVRKAAGSSSHTVIQVDANGQNSIIVFGGENMRPTEADIDHMLEGFGPGDAIIMQNELYNSPLMMRKAADKGLCVIFNPSPVNAALADYPLESVSWFLLNEIEGAALTGQTDPQAILAGMKEKYPKASVVLTLGADGAYCLHDGRTLYQPAFRVKAVDTTAAGDTFTGYFVSGLAQGMPMERIMERAARASSIAVGRMGAADSIPLADEVNAAEV